MSNIVDSALKAVSTVGWVVVLIVVLAFALLIANAVYLGKLNRTLKRDPGSGLELGVSKGTLTLFYVLDIILAVILGIFLVLWIIVLMKARGAASKAADMAKAQVASGAQWANAAPTGSLGVAQPTPPQLAAAQQYLQPISNPGYNFNPSEADIQQAFTAKVNAPATTSVSANPFGDYVNVTTGDIPRNLLTPGQALGYDDPRYF
jgi:hypothetical protein